MIRVFFITLIFSVNALNLYAQTYSWSGYTAGSTTYTTGIMTSTVTSSSPGFQNTTPKYYSGSTVGSGQCGMTGGLALENMFGNVTAAHATLTISFTSGNTTNGTCASMQFQIKDINADESLQTFRDFVHISAIDGTNTAIPAANIVITGGSNKAFTTSGNTKIIGGSTGTYLSRSQTSCDNVTITITPPAGTPLKSITIRYQPSYEAASSSTGYWSFMSPYRPAYQYISIGSLTGTATGGCIVLPVEITKFKGECESETKILEWETSSETNNKYFYIEGSEDADNFMTLGKMEGAGNSSNPNDYQFSLKDNEGALNYFRLKQEDFNGDVRFSETISIGCKHETDISLYPNPAAQSIFLSMDEDVPANRIEIYDLTGRLLLQQNFNDEFAPKREVNLAELSSSYYTIGIFDKNNSLIKAIPFVKE